MQEIIYEIDFAKRQETLLREAGGSLQSVFLDFNRSRGHRIKNPVVQHPLSCYTSDNQPVADSLLAILL